MTVLSHLTVLYDADCAKCTRWARWIERRDRRRDRLTCVPLQVAAPPGGATTADLERALHVVDADGSVFSGWDAVIEIARRIPVLAWLVPLSALPGVGRLGRRLYARSAGRRRCADCVDEPATPRRSQQEGPVDSRTQEG